MCCRCLLLSGYQQQTWSGPSPAPTTVPKLGWQSVNNLSKQPISGPGISLESTPPPTPPLWFKAFIPLFLSPMKPSLCNSWLEYQMHRRHQHAKRAQPRIKPAISQLLSNSVSYFNENLNIFKIFYLQDPDR